ncbi:MAG: tyrosine-type recombinase/integrase, partial [Rhabdochlamydiaceae bacterium]
MARRRPNGTGSLRHNLKSGYWEARLPAVIDQSNPSLTYRRKTYYRKTQKEALAVLDEETKKQARLQGKEPLHLRDWLAIWLEEKKISLRPRTAIRYGEILRHLPDKLLDKDLEEISIHDINELLKGTILGVRGQPLSPQTKAHIRAVLRSSFRSAISHQKMHYNVAEESNVIKVEKSKRIYLSSIEELRRLEKACQGEVIGKLVLFAVFTGMRQGELLGLKWLDYNIETKKLSISRQVQRWSTTNIETYLQSHPKAHTKVYGKMVETNPKTEAATRLILLDEKCQKLFQEQKEELDRLGVFEENGFVFSYDLNQPLSPDLVRY